MKVVIASTVAPFVRGGSTLMVDWLAQTLRGRGHLVDVLELPASSSFPGLLDEMLAMRLLDISAHGDRLIAIRPASYLLKHPAKVIWFIHHYRTAYDLWGTRYQNVPSTSEGLRFRDAVRSADRLAFSEARAIYANSRRTAARLRNFNNVASEVLYPPLFEPERYKRGVCGDYVFFPSRLTHHKRQWLAIEAMRYTKTPAKLVLAGAPDSGMESYVTELRTLVARYNLAEKVSIYSRWIPEDEKISLFSGCLATIYIPFDEDSYGYPSLESSHSGKPIITCSDSGGTLELICDSENGFVVSPDPEAIANVIDRLFLDRNRASEMGRAALDKIGHLRISWDGVVENLLR